MWCLHESHRMTFPFARADNCKITVRCNHAPTLLVYIYPCLYRYILINDPGRMMSKHTQCPRDRTCGCAFIAVDGTRVVRRRCFCIQQHQRRAGFPAGFIQYNNMCSTENLHVALHPFMPPHEESSTVDKITSCRVAVHSLCPQLQQKKCRQTIIYLLNREINCSTHSSSSSTVKITQKNDSPQTTHM